MLKIVWSVDKYIFLTVLPFEEGLGRQLKAKQLKIGLKQETQIVISFFFFYSFLQAVGKRSRCSESKWGFGEPNSLLRVEIFSLCPLIPCFLLS